MKTVITGGTGMVGRQLAKQMDEVVVLTRDAARHRYHFAGHELRGWDPRAGAPAREVLAGADVVVNLAGASVAEGRWTPERKQELRESRVTTTRNLVAGLAHLERRPSVLVSASAVGYYGDRDDELLDEASAPGTGFLPGLCAAWEREALEAQALGIRVVCLRFGVILDREEGALARMLLPFRLGLGGRLGSGRQWMPWLHLDDAVGLIRHVSEKPGLSGPVNAVAPQLVTNAEFTRTLADSLQRPAVMSVPRVALQFGLGEMSELLLASQMVVPRRAVADGYSFSFPKLAGALADLVGGGKGEESEERAAA